MNRTLWVTLVAALPITPIVVGSIVRMSRQRSVAAIVQVLGAFFLVVVLVIHLCEGLGLFPIMRWGQPDSVGHYADLVSVALGLSLFSLGYLLEDLMRPRS